MWSHVPCSQPLMLLLRVLKLIALIKSQQTAARWITCAFRQLYCSQSYTRRIISLYVVIGDSVSKQCSLHAVMITVASAALL